MAALVWPDRIPSRLYRAGASLPLEDTRRRFETSAGPGRLRRKMSTAVRPVAGVIDMTAAEYAWLQVFYRDTTKGGVLPFWFPDAERRDMPLLSDETMLGVYATGESPLLLSAWWLCQFGQEPPSPQPGAGGRMRVQLSLVVLP